MSYQGYVPLMVEYASFINNQKLRPRVRVLEIGVDRGQTALPLIANLNYRKIPFDWFGVDIRYDDVFSQQITLMEGSDHSIFHDQTKTDSYVTYEKCNSLDWLPEWVDRFSGETFDLVLIDGDHNYDTVKEELKYLDAITHDYSLVICDDYSGKHAGKDDFYSKLDTHKNLEHVSKHLDKSKNKGGVKAAIDEFLSENSPKWDSCELLPGYEIIALVKNLGFQIQVLNNVVSQGQALLHPENVKCTFGVRPDVPSSTESTEEGIEGINLSIKTF